MAIKEVSTRVPQGEDYSARTSVKTLSSSNLVQVRVSTEAAKTVSSARQNDAAVNLNIQKTSSTDRAKTQSRLKLNEALSAAHLAKDSVKELGDLVESVAGIVEQAAGTEVPKERLPILEQEGRQLAGELVDRAKTSPLKELPNYVSGETKVELQAHVDQTLSTLAPTKDAKSALVDFSSSAAITASQDKVSATQHQVNTLHQTVDKAAAEISKTVTSFEVVNENQQAATADVRDVEAAIDLANKLSEQIRLNREESFASFGNLDLNSARLLS